MVFQSLPEKNEVEGQFNRTEAIITKTDKISKLKHANGIRVVTWGGNALSHNWFWFCSWLVEKTVLSLHLKGYSSWKCKYHKFVGSFSVLRKRERQSKTHSQSDRAVIIKWLLVVLWKPLYLNPIMFPQEKIMQQNETSGTQANLWLQMIKISTLICRVFFIDLYYIASDWNLTAFCCRMTDCFNFFHLSLIQWSRIFNSLVTSHYVTKTDQNHSTEFSRL